MTKKTTKKTKNNRKIPKKSEVQRQATFKVLAFIFVPLFYLLVLAKMGAVGVFFYNVIRILVGSLAYLVLFIVALFLIVSAFKKELLVSLQKYVKSFIFFFLAAMLIYQTYFDKLTGTEHTWKILLKELTKLRVTEFVGAGMFGHLLYAPLKFLISPIGVFTVAAILIFLGTYFISPSYWHDSFVELKDSFDEYSSDRKMIREAKKIEKNTKKEAKREAKKLKRLEKVQRAQKIIETKATEELNVSALQSKRKLPTLEEGDLCALQPAETLPHEDLLDEVLIQDALSGEGIPFDVLPFKTPENFIPIVDSETGEILSPEIESERLDETQTADDGQPIYFEPSHEFSHYNLPTADLLAPTPLKNQANEHKNVQTNIKILEETFKSFGIQATVESAVVGPSVSKYEVKPATGVKVSRILNLTDDLALALAAKDVRIEAPIPGKSVVGIEIPNNEVAMVGFREMWEKAKTNSENLLEVPLGKAVDGSIKSFDLTKMPHLLVAGSTGSGKSVAVNGIITSILMKALPSQVKLLMIDPKMVELDVYNDIPHLLIPVVTNPRKAARALQKVVDEMENRYELFRRAGSRNIEGYNAKIEAFNALNEEKEQTLPLIVVVVDELSDLMMVASKEVEDAIIRIGQKARAAGIHMILATQRPSVDVISGLIKANVPSRVAFAVSSGTDSRTIIDSIGAEKLLGRGDMLFKPIDENHALRLQGAFLSDDDVASVVAFIKNQASADYDETFDPGETAEDGGRPFDNEGGAKASGDPLFVEAKQLVVETQKASASMLQRRLKTGFNRATRIMEELEEAGVIGPAVGTKPRQVLMTSADTEVTDFNQLAELENGENDDSI
ncbi:DNA translocase FtsK [Lactococcus hodotermopsidis]|uniref:DNA translocase FtsK n=1 Tax=Pseudolactococcus hodotermopsidis TaxID=2709157 RepID=A0A6A0BEK1_9LACT|nr:DNA translocase FtsK [Lactococcus hodotermopsidis]GFH42257.1 DNA translocase FtsK [Lactococcus hodotermopsidis]